MNVSYPVVFYRDGQPYAALITKKLAKGESKRTAAPDDLAVNLIAFDGVPGGPILGIEIIDVPYVGTDRLIPETGEYFVECGAPDNAERAQYLRDRDGAAGVHAQNVAAYNDSNKAGVDVDAQTQAKGLDYPIG